MGDLTKIISVKPDSDFTLSVQFDDGMHGLWHEDMSTCTGPMALPLRDPAFFAQASVVGGALSWPNGWDACADYV
jgi:hypothetical protein